MPINQDQSKRRRRSSRLAIPAIVFGAVTVLAVCQYVVTKHSIHRIASIDTSWEGYVSGYEWLGKDTLLIERGHVTSLDSPPDDDSEIYDLRSDRIVETKKSWERLLGSYESLYDRNMALSPDRKHLIYTDIFGPQILPVSNPVAGFRDNASHRPFGDRSWGPTTPGAHAYPPQSISWNRADAPWLAVNWHNGYVNYYCGDQTGKVTRSGRAFVPPSIQSLLVSQANGKPIKLVDSNCLATALGSTCDGALLILLRPVYMAPSSPAHSGLILLRIPSQNLALKDQAPQFTEETVPPGFDFTQIRVNYDTALSPRGDRIAWVFPYRRKPSKVETLMARIDKMLGLKPATNSDTAIWLSDTRGRHMRLVAAWYCGSTQDYSLKWSPDGSTISFEQGEEIPPPPGKPDAGLSLTSNHMRTNIMAVTPTGG